jgi:hypothetical protein
MVGKQIGILNIKITSETIFPNSHTSREKIMEVIKLTPQCDKRDKVR